MRTTDPRTKSLHGLKGQFARLYMDALDAPRSRRDLIARAFISAADKMHAALGTTGRSLTLDSPEYVRPLTVADYCRRTTRRPDSIKHNQTK